MHKQTELNWMQGRIMKTETVKSFLQQNKNDSKAHSEFCIPLSLDLLALNTFQKPSTT